MSYGYDEKGRLISLTDWDSQTSNFDYDGANRHIETVRPNQLVSDYIYDPAGRLLDLTHHVGETVQAQFSYVVDGRGNRVQATETLLKPDDTSTQQTLSYSYDKLQRLLSASYDTDRSYAYAYDLAGNRTQEQATIGITTTTTNWNHNAANQIATMQIGANPAVSFQYDPNGNLTSDGQLTYTWDRANRQTMVNNGIANTHYAYDGNGDRYQQTVGGVVTSYLNDIQPGLTKLLASTTSDDTERFIHGPQGLHVHWQAGSEGAIWGQSTWGDAVWGGGPSWHYMLQDGLGSVRTEVDVNADVLASQSYAPYGLPIDLNGSFDSPFGFTGEQIDSNALNYNRARYYNPMIGTFTALDPWEGIQNRPMSLNGYSWVEGNVINAVDPSGKSPVEHVQEKLGELSIKLLDDIQSLHKMAKEDPSQLISKQFCDLYNSSSHAKLPSLPEPPDPDIDDRLLDYIVNLFQLQRSSRFYLQFSQLWLLLEQF
nr:RHS repeat-associated core domain-containing protein [Phototrophicus methaneseepsis]